MHPRDPSAGTLIAEHGGKKAITSAFAWYQTAKSTAGALGKGLTGILLTLTLSNFSLVFGVAFVLSVPPLFIIACYVPKDSEWGTLPVEADAAQSTAQDAGVAHPHSETGEKGLLLPFMGLGFAINGTATMLSGLFPILATKYAGLTEAETGIIYAASMLVSGPLFGWLSDNVNRELVLMVRSIANTCSSLVYILAPSFLGILVGRVTDDMGKAAFRPAWGALMARLSDLNPRNRARTVGLMSVGEDAGGLVGPVLAGFLWSTFGVVPMLGARILFAIAAEGYAFWLTRSLAAQSDRVEGTRRLPSLHSDVHP